MSREVKPKALPPPYVPAEAPLKIIKALNDLSAGEATDHQQKMALQWIVNEASRAYVPAYCHGADGSRDTDFALGRAFVGQQIIGLLKIDLISLTGEENA